MPKGPSQSIDWRNCIIAGEALSGNNPDYCFAFYEKEYALSAEDDDLDCCWTADEHSKLPPLLSKIVTVHSNDTM